MSQSPRSTAHIGRFLIYAPFYQPNSYGIRVLYLLVELLRELGQDAFVVCFDHKLFDLEALPKRYRGFFLREDADFWAVDVRPDDVVIYPDVVAGNPLGATQVVRYLLNRPIVLTGEPIAYGETDLVVSYSAWVDEHAPRLHLLCDDRHTFYPADLGEKTGGALLYLGKKPHTPLPPAVRRFVDRFGVATVITRSSPPTRLELGDLLRKSRVLVSTDPLTNLIYEATLCNTPALVVDDAFSVTRAGKDLPLWGVFSHPVGFGEAANDAKKAFPLYAKALEGNRTRVRAFLKLCAQHFTACRDVERTGWTRRAAYAQLRGVRAELDELRYRVLHGGATITGVGAAPVAEEQHAVAQLFVDTGNGFQEPQSLAAFVPGPGRITLRFDTSTFDTVRALRFDPARDAVHCRLIAFSARTLEGQRLDLAPLVTSNAATVRGVEHLFFDNDPSFTVSRGLGQPLSLVTLELEYLAVRTSMADYPHRANALMNRRDTDEAQLYVDGGAGFSEAQSIVRVVPAGGRLTLELSLGAWERVKALRFDPARRPVMVRVHAVTAFDAHGKPVALPLSSSNGFLDKDRYLFTSDDPQLCFTLPEARALSRLVVEYTAEDLPTDAGRTSKPEAIRAELLAMVGRYLAARDDAETPGQAPEVATTERMVAWALDFARHEPGETERLEHRLAGVLGRDHALVVSSGEVANELAVLTLTSLELGDRRLLPGDEVIVSAAAPFDRVAPLVRAGAVPVLVDVQLGCYVPSLERLEAALTPKTRAVLLTSAQGVSAATAEVAELCRARGVWLIDDVVVSLRGRADGALSGAVGDLSIFSFAAKDGAPASEGGALTTSNAALARVARALRDGAAVPAADGAVGPSVLVGARPSEWTAALLGATLEHRLALAAARRERHALVTSTLSAYREWLVPHRGPPGSEPAWTSYVVAVRPTAGFDREELLAGLAAEERASCAPVEGTVATHPALAGLRYRVSGTLEHAMLLSTHAFTIDVSPAMTNDRLHQVLQGVDRFFRARMG